MEPTVSILENEPATANKPSWTARAPVRGTQSFVDTMGAVWRRPGVTACELLWRWVAGIPLLLLVAWQVKRLWPSTAIDTAALAGMTVFRPLEAFETIRLAAAALDPVFLPLARWLVPLALAAWSLVWVVGRSVVLRQLDASLRFRLVSLFILRLVRSVLLLALLFVWGLGVRWAAILTISGPAAHGQEPNLVFFCALVICGSLGLFVGWAAMNWTLDAAPLVAMQHGSSPLRALKGVFNLRSTRGRLIEINLVMSIVKIALLVLALVFSACPLPFQDVTTEEFLRNWWIGIAVFYFLASDYFHVVRSAAYLELMRESDAHSDVGRRS